jgi:hypothetical protein
LGSSPRIISVRIEQLRAVDLVIGDVPLPFGRDQVIDELLAELVPDDVGSEAEA